MDLDGDGRQVDSQRVCGAVEDVGQFLESQAWRQWQKELVDAGKHDEAMEMEYRDMQQRFPGKYDNEIDIHRNTYGGSPTCP